MESRKPGEIAICRAERQPMLYRKCGEMCIRHEVAMYAGERKQVAQYSGMPVGRLGDPCCFSREPAQNLLPCSCHGQGTAKRSRVSCDAQKGKQARPRQPHSSGATELPVKPVATLDVLVRFGVTCVNQQVDVDQNHLNPSPSR